MADYSTIPRTPLERELDTALHLTLDRAEAAEAELARVQGKLDALLEAFEKNGSLGILQTIAADKNLPPEIRVRAAGLAVPFERGRPATVNVVGVVDFRERVKAARLRADAELRAKWAREAEAAKTIEHQPTILGNSGPEGHDPAA
jgi:hypothetical protein